jgi:hypothetical protein
MQAKGLDAELTPGMHMCKSTPNVLACVFVKMGSTVSNPPI